MTITERLWVWLHRTFPERQIYVRSQGRVQFFTIGASLQAMLAGLTIIALGWVAFASVNVIFKDRIIAAKQHRYQQMQLAYENRVADLQMAYDELNGAVIQSVSRADAFVAKARKQQAALATLASPVPRKINSNVSGTSFWQTTALQAALPAALDEDIVRPIANRTSLGTANPTIPVMANARQIFLNALSWLSGGSKRRRKTIFSNPSLVALNADTRELGQLAHGATALMASADNLVLGATAQQRKVILRTGIDPIHLFQKVESQEGIGGPEIPIDDVNVDGIDDRDFSRAYLRGEADLTQLSELISVIGHLPLTVPVTAVVRTSGFGPRLDPFSGHYAFHPGIDFAGPAGAPVEATAPGTVAFAGSDGSYGNMVEIDHGFGLHTRYAHLLAITVNQGARVTKGTIVGRLGSTGRSTGPHVHYEVWYDNVVRNPDNFIRAGNCKVSGC